MCKSFAGQELEAEDKPFSSHGQQRRSWTLERGVRQHGLRFRILEFPGLVCT